MNVIWPSLLRGCCVKLPPQSCTKVLEALLDESFGSCPSQSEEYRAACHRLFPLATTFMPPVTEDDKGSAPRNNGTINHEMLTNEI